MLLIERRAAGHAREDYPDRDDENWMKHTYAWLNEDGTTRIDYRPVHEETLTNDVQAIPPRKGSTEDVLMAEFKLPANSKVREGKPGRLRRGQKIRGTFVSIDGTEMMATHRRSTRIPLTWTIVGQWFLMQL